MKRRQTTSSVHYLHKTPKKIIPILFIPWIMATLMSYDPVSSYFIAWLGSFFIFFLSIGSLRSHHPLSLPVSTGIMRPAILLQLVFAGFMCCTSIFYFMDHLGYRYFENISAVTFEANEHTEIIAKCQRLSLLAHTALTTGIIFTAKATQTIKFISIIRTTSLFALTGAGALLIALSLLLTPAFIQFRQPLLNISISCSAALFIKGITNRNLKAFIPGALTFLLNLADSIFTGYKENVILNFILIAFIAYPHFKKTILLLSLPALYLLIYLLPLFTTVIRKESWINKKTKPEAGITAYNILTDELQDEQIISGNWEFLTNRLSEIGMFTSFVSQAPELQYSYGRNILQNALYALVPRVFWEEKPDTEQLAMERVYQSGIVNRASTVSAKTRPVVDAYLIGGTPGVFIAMLLYGILAQSICHEAESLFGGYHFGCVIIFNSLFQNMWRGNTFEFLINNILYAYLLMKIIHWLLSITKILIPNNHENPAH